MPLLEMCLPRVAHCLSGLRYTRVWNAAGLQSSDMQEAILSAIKKKKPTFEKL